MDQNNQTLLLEGLLPAQIWNALIVLLILFGVFVAVFKGVVAIRDEIDKRKKKKALNNVDVTEQIADKVMEKLTPAIDKKFTDFEKKFDKRLEDIDKKLASDKETLELHTAQLNAEHARVDRLDNDSKALCHGVFALLSHQVTGNSIDKLKKAESAMKNYLIDGKYNEADWK